MHAHTHAHTHKHLYYTGIFSNSLLFVIVVAEGVFTAKFDKEDNVPASMLFVGNIPWNSTEATLKTAFEGCIGVKIIREHRTGRSKG